VIDFQEKRRILISAPRYIAPITVEETEKLGYEVRVEKDNALSVRGNLADAMKLNLWLRTAHKVQFHLFEGRAKNIDEFYTLINEFAWEDLIPEVEDAKLLITWLEKGVFDALEKKYVSFVIISIFSF